MSDAGESLEIELGELCEYSWRERSSRVWRLAQRGHAIASPLQRIRRHGPGRLRAVALEVLVMIVGEGGLHPADLAAAERLVRIKAPLEPALGISVSPEEMHTKVEDDPAMDEAFCDFSYACTARTVAAELSIDIVGGCREAPPSYGGWGCWRGRPTHRASASCPAHTGSDGIVDLPMHRDTTRTHRRIKPPP
ncbi:hypothetical protein Asi03nite_68020 [Actinoplanes siamensis]|uniref:Uncharacterized protein n=1 Tax=Actinoplanes siamensis TaxID=1223317 RepID=A0A919TNY0_9ACTN|nr:hypothetical protein Asi03nite_68020 [Actinoplanes siamensis]